MNRRARSIEQALSSALVLVAASLIGGPLSDASAQVAMHREVPRGDVTGLEMGIEGTLEATPGAPVRWWITLYEVVRRRELRPAASCSVRAMASHERAEPITSVMTDASGRAALVMPMTTELAESPHLVLDATCPRGVRRLFDVDLELATRERVILTFDRPTVSPAGSVLAIGRVIDRATGRGIPNTDVNIHVSQSGPIGAPRRVVTDASGVFATRITTGSASTDPINVTAITVHEDAPSSSASRGLTFASAPTPPALALRLTTDPAVAAPGALVDVTVEVRGADGLPVEGALVAGPPTDPLPEDSEEPAPEIRTDARGLAHHPWRLPLDLEAGALVEASAVVEVTSTALGSTSQGVSVRVARRATFASIALSGGVLVPGAPTRIYARVVGPDGAALAQRDVELVSAILGSVDGAPIGRARTDAEGLVAFDVPRVADAAIDDCGGTTAASIEVLVQGERTALCVPVDPDALLTVRGPARIAQGAPVPITITRTSRAEGRAMIVTALRRGTRGWEPIAQEIVAANASQLSLALGPEANGEIWLRARVIVDGGQVVRGASSLVSVSPSPASLSVEADRTGARVSGSDPSDSVIVLIAGAAPGTSSGQIDLVSELAGDLSSDARMASLEGLALEAELAVRVPLDAGASSILRGGLVVPQAMPEDPVAFGLLRDPWRTRARFVRGRLGRLFLAVEHMVEQRIPARLGEVASQGPGGWVWNREMLAAAVSEAAIDDEGSASLDGEPLDIEALVALEPTFTFDHVARRITRARLFRVIRAIRQITHERNLDLPWARRGDPRTWIASLVDVALGDGTSLETNDLFDAWGRAFVFRPTTRRSFLPAIEGWEVASLGPDGRDGNPDDVFDPFARVVPSGSLYADAVGEDALVARVSGVALGRAWIAQLEEESGGNDYEAMMFEEAATLGPLAEAWEASPTRIAVPPPVGGYVPIAVQSGAYLGTTRAHRWTLPPERRPYAAVAIAVPRDGRPRVASHAFEAGARLTLRTQIPELLRVGDRLSVPVVASELEGADAPELTMTLEGEGVTGSLRAVVRGQGGSTTADLALDARDAGSVEIVLTARRGTGDDAESLEVRRRVRVVPGGALVATHTSALIQRGESVALLRGAGSIARDLGTTVSIATPRALDELPFFTAIEQRNAGDAGANAAVLAWARALEGRLDPELAARALRAGARPLVDVCTLVALSTTTEHAQALAVLRQRVASTTPADLRERAAMMVALSGVASAGAAPSGDGVGALFANLRTDGWRALATERSVPSVMARVAAGLLLTNADDGPGRALYRSAVESLVTNEHGERVVPGDPMRVGDGWIGTLALALAARQVGDDAVADALARAASRELHLLSRTDAEGPFWLLAASVFGAFGSDSRAEAASDATVPVEISGARRELTRAELRARIDVASDAAIALSGGDPVVVALESRALRELADRHDAGFDARVEGVLGDTARLGESGARSALELVITAGPSDVVRPVIEIEIPALASLDVVARGALSRSQAVAHVSEPDRGGVVRLTLAPLRAETTVRVPLVVAWLGAGRVRGLGVVAYDATSPTRMTTHAARVIELGAHPNDTAQEASR